MSKIIDITMVLDPGYPPFPGDPGVSFETYKDVERGDPYRAVKLSMLNHAGTHIDTPAHFLPNGMRVDAIPLETLIGPAYVARTGACRIGPEDLEACAGTVAQRRLILKTPNSARPELYEKPFRTDFCSLTPSGARWIADKGFVLVGIDCASAELFDDAEHEAHRILLEAGIVILEWLVLSHVEPGAYELTCLPLKLGGLDGAPARAVLRTIG
ncbi:MAG: cyclase family protein [Oceanidesulfovibrio sp.]